MTDARESRRLTRRERELVKLLLSNTDSSASADALDLVEVEPMDDGGMGSLYFPHPEKARAERRLGRCIGQTEFTDDDGVLVSATLNVDQEGDLFELDVWKTDFSPVSGLRGRRSED